MFNFVFCSHFVLKLQTFLYTFLFFYSSLNISLKNAGLFQPKFGSNMNQPKCWIEDVIKKFTAESESWS